MTEYYVNRNAQPTGEREVHAAGCTYMPEHQHCVPLGAHPNCQSAVLSAEKIFPNVDGCKFCCPDSHMI